MRYRALAAVMALLLVNQLVVWALASGPSS